MKGPQQQNNYTNFFPIWVISCDNNFLNALII